MSVRFTNPALERKAKAEKRLRIFYFGLCFGYLIVVGKAVTLMSQDNQKLEKIAMSQYRAAIQKFSDRSRVLDRKGQEFAISTPTWSFYSDPREIKNFSETASLLAGVLNIPKETLEQKFKEKRKFVWIKRRVDATTMEKINQLNLNGIYSIKENMRLYPHGELAGSVMGAVGIDSQALGGIELAYDSYLMLNQEPGMYLRDARGQLYLAPPNLESISPKGDVYLTIDKNIQFFAEEALKRAARTYSAKAGVALIMDPETGDIMAMANYPSFNPNQFEKADFNVWRNRAVTDLYEPGSTFKVIVAAAALDHRSIKLDEKFNCERGSFVLEDGEAIHDHDPYGLLNISDIIKVSSNIGIYKVSQRLGREKFYQTIKDFGFGSKTGVDFPGEIAGILRPVQKWRPIEAGTISFGQGIGVTSLQILSAFSAIANGGLRVQPHLVEKIVSKNGETLYQKEHRVLARPIQEETAQILTQILKSVVAKGGTAPLATIEEYPVAGKTGTSQKVDPKRGGYLEGKYIASFVGYAPADHPKLVALVLLDEPQGYYYGGIVAAPVFKEIMLKSLNYLGVPPQGTSSEVLVASKQQSSLSHFGFMKTTTEIKKEGNYFKVPDFRGVSLRQVLKTAGDFPVAMEFKGRGEAISQSPAPGTLVAAGSKIYVEFKPLY